MIVQNCLLKCTVIKAKRVQTQNWEKFDQYMQYSTHSRLYIYSNWIFSSVLSFDSWIHLPGRDNCQNSGQKKKVGIKVRLSNNKQTLAQFLFWKIWAKHQRFYTIISCFYYLCHNSGIQSHMKWFLDIPSGFHFNAKLPYVLHPLWLFVLRFLSERYQKFLQS